MKYKTLIKVVAPIVNMLWPTTIINKQKFTQGKGVYICNHYSIMDANPLCVQLFKHEFRFLVKEEVCKGKLGKFLNYMGAIPIKRGEADLHAIRECMTTLREGKSLLIFPEGSRNMDPNSKEMLPFKDGPAVFAIKTKAPIVPMLYYKSTKLFRRTYLIIGDSIDTNNYMGMPINLARETATNDMIAAMVGLRSQLDEIVENKSKLRAAKKTERAANRQARKANRIAKKLSKKAKKAAIDVDVDSNNQ